MPSAARFSPIKYDPGNAQFPTLPDGVAKAQVASFVGGAFLSARPGDLGDREFARSAGGAARFSGWYLDKSWITPLPVAFGSIASDTDRSFTIYNTRRTAISVTSIDLSGVPGLSLIAPASLPATIESFESITVTLRASQTGSDDFDDTIQIVTSAGTLNARVTGQRIIIFDMHPDTLVEQLQFNTQLLRSRDGTEQAMATRITPRRNLTANIGFHDDTERQKAHALLIGRPPLLLIAVPEFQEAREIDVAALSTDATVFIDTSNSTFEAGRKVYFRLPDESSVSADIQTVQADRLVLTNPLGFALPLRTLGMPSYLNKVTREPSMRISPMNYEAMSVTFTAWDVPNLGASAPSLITEAYSVDGLTILTAPNAMGGATKPAAMSRNENIFDSEQGAIFTDTFEKLGEYTSRFQATARTEAEVFAWREFAHYVFGSWRAFYIPSYQNDLPAALAIDPAATFIDVPAMGIKRFLDAQVPRRDLRVQHKDGVGTKFVDYTRITSVDDNGATERININPPLTNAAIVEPAELLTSWMNLCRVAGDVVTLSHDRLGRATVRFNYRSVVL